MGAIYKTAAGEAAVRSRYAEFLGRWPVPSEQLRLSTAQGETFVIASGPKDAPAVLLLHGSAANSASWMGDVADWSQRFHLYAVDMIGEPGFSAPARPPLASDAYVAWLDEVMAGLGLSKAALVGISLGGWLALTYATARPDRVSAMALLCPGGVGRHKNVLLWAAPLLLLGSWGRRRIMRRIAGGASTATPPSPAMQAFGAFQDLIFANFRPRTERLPIVSDAALGRLAMPVLAILGGKDVFIDSPGSRARLQAHVAGAEIRYLPDAGHLLVRQTEPIHGFLRKALAP